MFDIYLTYIDIRSTFDGTLYVGLYIRLGQQDNSHSFLFRSPASTLWSPWTCMTLRTVLRTAVALTVGILQWEHLFPFMAASYNAIRKYNRWGVVISGKGNLGWHGHCLTNSVTTNWKLFECLSNVVPMVATGNWHILIIAPVPIPMHIHGTYLYGYAYLRHSLVWNPLSYCLVPWISLLYAYYMIVICWLLSV